MPMQRTYDDPDVMFKLRADGEGAEHKTVIGKTEFDKAVSEGWQPMENLRDIPKLPYDKTLYRPNGDTKIVHNRDEDEAAQVEGWVEQRYAAKPEVFVSEPGWPAEKGSKAEFEAAASKQTVDLALKLMESNEKVSAQQEQINTLMQQNAEILALLKDGKKGK